MTSRAEDKANSRFKALAENYKSHQLGDPTWRQIGSILANQLVKFGWYPETEFPSLARRISIICAKPTDAEKEKNQLNLISRGGGDEPSRVRLVVQMLFFFRQEEELT